MERGALLIAGLSVHPLTICANLLSDFSMVLICDHCHGAAMVGGVRCRACMGGGAAVAWGDRVLVWSRPVDRAAIVERSVARVVHVITGIVVAVGALLVLVTAFLASQDNIITATGITDAGGFFRDPRVGLAVLLVCVVVTLRQRQRDRVASLPLVAPKDLAAALAPVSDWRAFTADQRVDVAARLSPEARTALDAAGALATRLHHATVDPIHLFAAVVGTRSGGELLARLGVDPQGLKARIEAALARLPQFAQTVMLAPASFTMLFHAYTDAVRTRRPALGALRILTSCAAHDETVAAILEDLAVTPATITNASLWVHVREEVVARYRRYRSLSALRPKRGMNRAMTAIATPILDAYAEDLTLLAAHGATGPVVGREHEFRELLRIFESGRQGAVLIGGAGVGKEAILEGLAERMAADDVPELLRDKRFVRVSVARLTSGADPAVAQERLLAMLDEVTKSRNIVLAIADLEHLVGTGAAIDLDDVLAGELERGGLVLISTTTPQAYAAHVEQSALGHALAPIHVQPPEGNEAIQILAARSIRTEARHRVYFTYAAIVAALELSSRFLHETELPEKAVTLLEEAAAAVAHQRGAGAAITREDIAALIEEKTGVPAREVAADEAQKLLRMEETLHERIVGQDEAVRAVASALRRSRAGLHSGKRPIAVFLFLGPTGVGKTELAKTVAETYFGSEDAMVRLDMSEYQETASLRQILGAPGSGQGGVLTEAVRRQPFAIVLLDEFEKAHPDVLNVFLQVFEDGRLTDAAGRTIDFTNTIVIATSNAGTQYVQDAVARGEAMAAIRTALMERELRGTYRPELLNRFDGVILFTPLTMEHVHQIAQRLLAKVAKRLEEKGMEFRATDAAVAELATAGFDPLFGARPLRRALQERVEDPIANFLLTNQAKRRDAIVLDAGGVVRIEHAAALT